MIHALVLLLFLFPPNPAGAQSAGPPAYSVGDEWTLSIGLTRTVVKVDGDVTVIRGYSKCPMCLLHVDKNLYILKLEGPDEQAVDSLAVGFVPVGRQWRYWEFPLEVGKKWTFGADGLVQNNINHYDVAIVVEAYEDIATRAGTFKAFRLRRDFVIRPVDNRGRGFSWSERTWFAPSAKAAAKLTTTNPNGVDWEITAYTVK